MNNKFWNIRPVVVLLLVVSAVFVAATAFWNATLFYIELTLWAAMAVFSHTWTVTFDNVCKNSLHCCNACS